MKRVLVTLCLLVLVCSTMAADEPVNSTQYGVCSATASPTGIIIDVTKPRGGGIDLHVEMPCYGDPVCTTPDFPLIYLATGEYQITCEAISSQTKVDPPDPSIPTVTVSVGDIYGVQQLPPEPPIVVFVPSTSSTFPGYEANVTVTVTDGPPGPPKAISTCGFEVFD
jgi:hypothetical protein